MTRAAAIGTLLPADRDVYRVHRGMPAHPPRPGGHLVTITDATCIRCGGLAPLIDAPERGPRATLVFYHRQRGTIFTNVKGACIHVGCVPSGDSDAPRGIPARSRRASQVRA